MFFRFACAITLLTCVSLVGIAIEKQNLALKREISSQHYDIQNLKEQRCRLVLETQRLATPTRLQEQLNSQPSLTTNSSHNLRTPKPLSNRQLREKEEPTDSQPPSTPPLLNWHLNRRSE